MTRKFLSILSPCLSMAASAAIELDDSYMEMEPRLEPRPALFYWLIGAGVAAFLVLLGCLLYWWKRKARRIRPAPTPYEIAVAALQSLLSDGLPERGESKLFHQRLSGILRQYLEERFGVSAPKLTTEEFLQLLTQTPALVQEHRSLLQDFLKACDMVKFAGASSCPAEMRNLADSCRHFLEQTREPPQAATPEAQR